MPTLKQLFALWESNFEHNLSSNTQQNGYGLLPDTPRIPPKFDPTKKDEGEVLGRMEWDSANNDIRIV